MRFRTALVMAALVGSRAFGADDVAALIDKMASAYGGSQRLQQVTARRETGRVEAATQVGRSGPLLRVFARPLKLRVEVGAAGGEIRVLDGGKAWRNGKAVTGPVAQAMLLQAVRLDLPWQLLVNRHTVKEKDGREYHGRHLRILEMPLADNLLVEAGIDPATGQILFTAGSIPDGPMGAMTFETEYDDLRLAGGLLFAFKETNLAAGTKTAETVLTKIELLKAPPDGAFKP